MFQNSVTIVEITYLIEFMYGGHYAIQTVSNMLKVALYM